VTDARNQLLPGDPAPMFRAPSNINPDFDFGTAAGRYLVLSFLGPEEGGAKARFDAFLAGAAIFANPDCYFFGVVSGKAAGADSALTQARPGMDMFWDEGAVAQKYGAVEPVSFLIGLDLRILAVVKQPDPARHAMDILDILKRLPQIGPYRRGGPQAPVLLLPGVFEPALCRRLIEGYEAAGGEESGFMREKDGKTVLVIDHKHKRRSDWTIDDETLKGGLGSGFCGASFRRSRRRSSSRSPAWSATSSPATTPASAGISRRTATTPPRAPRTAASPSPST
jgi:hypothetical protein